MTENASYEQDEAFVNITTNATPGNVGDPFFVLTDINDMAGFGGAPFERMANITARIAARDVTGGVSGDAAYWIISATFRTDGTPTITQVGATTTLVYHADAGAAGWTVGFVTTADAGNDYAYVQLQITGEAATTIWWHAVFEIHYLGTERAV